MSLKKDDVVELIEKEDNGWWLVRMNGVEGWAPNNYLELVPQSAPAPPTVPPPRKAPLPKVDITPSAASATTKPVSVFPGKAPSNGSATPWKVPPSNSDANSRPPSSLASKAPPPVATKPKPPVGAKPSVGKPTILAAPRPTASNVKSPSVPGQVDLAAAVSLSFSQFFLFQLTPSSFSFLFSRSSRSVLKEWRITTNIQTYIPNSTYRSCHLMELRNLL